MFMGWSYILSARHIERRRVTDEDGVFYTDIRAPRTGEAAATGHRSYTVPIRSKDARECRWWAAILAKGCGWRAVLCRKTDVFHTRWSRHLEYEEHTELDHDCEEAEVAQASPPSASQARDYLVSFAKRNNVYDQLHAALVQKSCYRQSLPLPKSTERDREEDQSRL